MTTFPLPAAAGAASVRSDPLTVAVAGFLATYKGLTREHTASDLRCFFTWCGDQSLDPLAAQRSNLELYVRWMQERRGFRPSTVSRRFSVVAGFYRIAVVDGLLVASPAQHVRRPVVPAESPTLGLTHLQFEALLTAARESCNINDFALVCLLGLLGLRIFEATGADIADLSEQHGHRVLRVLGKGGKVALVPLPPAVGRAVDRAVDGRVAGPLLRTRDGTRMDRHAATRRLHRLARAAGVRLPRMHPHMLRHTFVTTMLDAGVDLRDVQIAARHGTPTRGPRCATTAPAPTSTVTPTTRSQRSWPPEPDAYLHSAPQGHYHRPTLPRSGSSGVGRGAAVATLPRCVRSRSPANPVVCVPRTVARRDSTNECI